MSINAAFTQTISRAARKMPGLRQRFMADTSGSLAVPFALGLGVILMGVGVATDLGRHVAGKERVQDVADIASLAAAKDVDASDAELLVIAQKVFEQHFGPSGASLVASATRDGDAVTVRAKGAVDTTFMGLFGEDEMGIDVSSTSVYSERRMDIALVLDTTESMTGSRMDSLRQAATDLVDTVSDFEGESVRLAVMPFAEHINVGTSRRGAEWLDVPADETRPRWERVPGTERNCRQRNGTRNRDGRIENVSWWGCDYDWRPAAPVTVTWQGCVGSRMGGRDERPEYDGVPIPGLVGNVCAQEILPLTADMAAVRQSVQNLRATNDLTYMPAGITWGWRALNGEAPLQTADLAPDNDRVMVVMTDGDNTRSKTGIRHTGPDNGQADRKTERLCEAAKADGIRIFTIAYEVDTAATRNMLADCATDASSYFDARDAQDLRDAFTAIGNSIIELRIAS